MKIRDRFLQIKKGICNTRCLTLPMVVVVFVFAIPFFGLSIKVQAEDNSRTASYYGLDVKKPTIPQIASFVSRNPTYYGMQRSMQYKVKPSLSKPYSTGQISSNHIADGLNAVNIMRYIAGLSSNVTTEGRYNSYAQAASMINSINDVLTHFPKRPSGMSSSMYKTAYTGASQSNIAYGYTLLSNSIISGYMKDGDSANIAKMGHRRWILNPKLLKTGFGFSPGRYSAMYAVDQSNHLAVQTKVAWPANNTPIEYFNTQYPFTLSLDESFDRLSRSRIKITLTRKSDQRVWKFDKDTPQNTNSVEYFSVDNNPYGQPRCIIWRPKGISAYSNGSSYTVKITGVTKQGKPYPIQYNVNFFSVNEAMSALSKKTVVFKDGDKTITSTDVWTDSRLQEYNPQKKAGYSFVGWYYDKALTKPFSYTSIISKNTTLYAGYVKPDQPISGVQAVALGDGGVVLLWKKQSTHFYEVQAYTQDKPQFKTIAITRSNVYAARNLVKGKTYYFRVRSYKSFNGIKVYSGYSSTIKAIA